MIPLTILGGWLGSGKTTLLNRLLAEADQRIAVVVNDIGEVNIDAALIQGADDEIVELTNGCVCCSIGGSLALTLKELSERVPPPEHIMVEASGVADPSQVARYGDRRVVPLDAIITVVDATDIERRLVDPTYGPLARRQIEAADLLVVTKTQLPGAVLPDLAVLSSAPAITDDADGLAVRLLTATPTDRAPFDRAPFDPGAEPTSPAVATAALDLDSPVDIDHVLAVLGAEPDLLRAKGVVATPAGPMVVHRAGTRVDATPAPGREPTPLILIARDEPSLDRIRVNLG